MPVELIRQPDGLGVPLGRYSQIAIATGTQIVAIAGQVGITSGGELAGDGSLAAQTRQAFANVATALHAVGLGTGDIFKTTTTYLVATEPLAEFMAARTAAFAEFFSGGEYPPNTLIMVSRLVQERLSVEVEALAIRTGQAAG